MLISMRDFGKVPCESYYFWSVLTYNKSLVFERIATAFENYRKGELVEPSTNTCVVQTRVIHKELGRGYLHEDLGRPGNWWPFSRQNSLSKSSPTAYLPIRSDLANHLPQIWPSTEKKRASYRIYHTSILFTQSCIRSVAPSSVWKFLTVPGSS